MFQIGEIVTLQTGGPRMRVIEITEDGEYICEWSRPSGLREQKKFSGDVLTVATE